jgi:hypothetical protein
MSGLKFYYSVCLGGKGMHDNQFNNLITIINIKVVFKHTAN